MFYAHNSPARVSNSFSASGLVVTCENMIAVWLTTETSQGRIGWMGTEYTNGFVIELDEEAWKKFVDLIERPPQPTQALIDLLRDESKDDDAARRMESEDLVTGVRGRTRTG